MQSAAYCYNISVNDTTKETPFYLIFGRDPRLNGDILLSTVDEEYSTKDPLTEGLGTYLQQHLKRLRTAWAINAINTEKSMMIMKEAYDRSFRAKESVIRTGDVVTFRKYTLKFGQPSKFANHWEGAFRVHSIQNSTAEIISLMKPESGTRKVHLDQIKILRRPENLPVVTKDGFDVDRFIETMCDEDTSDEEPERPESPIIVENDALTSKNFPEVAEPERPIIKAKRKRQELEETETKLPVTVTRFGRQTRVPLRYSV